MGAGLVCRPPAHPGQANTSLPLRGRWCDLAPLTIALGLRPAWRKVPEEGASPLNHLANADPIHCPAFLWH